VRAVRYLLRVSVLMLVGVAVFCGLVLLFNAQVALNRYAELYMKDGEAPAMPPAEVATNRSHINAPALASATSKPAPASRSPAAGPQSAPPATPTEGERAMAIRVSNAARVVAAAAADRWVDVVLTYRNGTTFSEVVLENVRVLTIEPIVAEGGVGEGSDVHAVTLDVDAESAHNLLLASKAGALSLVLRKVDDRGPTEAVHATETGQAGIADAAVGKPTSTHDESRFIEVTVSRGGTSTVHRVLRER
jgi:Flp pilus assembly protein RcpC/CpaB